MTGSPEKAREGAPLRRWHVGCAFGPRNSHPSLPGECALPPHTAAENPSRSTGPQRSPRTYDACTLHRRARSPVILGAHPHRVQPPRWAWVSAEDISAEQLEEDEWLRNQLVGLKYDQRSA